MSADAKLRAFKRILNHAWCPHCQTTCHDTYLCSSCNWLHCGCCNTRLIEVPPKIAKAAHKRMAEQGQITYHRPPR